MDAGPAWSERRGSKVQDTRPARGSGASGQAQPDRPRPPPSRPCDGARRRFRTPFFEANAARPAAPSQNGKPKAGFGRPAVRFAPEDAIGTRVRTSGPSTRGVPARVGGSAAPAAVPAARSAAAGVASGAGGPGGGRPGRPCGYDRRKHPDRAPTPAPSPLKPSTSQPGTSDWLPSGEPRSGPEPVTRGGRSEDRDQATLELIDRAKDGDGEAWNRLYGMYRGDLERRIRARLGRELRGRVEEADVMQTVWGRGDRQPRPLRVPR